MKKRLFTLVLSLILVLGMLPVTARAAAPDIYVGGVGMVSGDYLANGATATTATEPTGGYAHYDNGVLTLNGYYYSGRGYETNDERFGIYRVGDLEIILKGKNTLNISDNYKEHYGICTAGGDLTFSEGKTDSSLTINAQNGILTDDRITVESGSFTITAGRTGIVSLDSGITVNGGVFSVSAGEAALAATSDIVFNGGTFDISSETAILSLGNIVIQDGAFFVSATAYGICSMGGSVAISSGNITVRITVADGGCAIYGAAVTIGSDLSVLASTEPYGTLGEYVPANNHLYKLIVIRPAPKNLPGDVNVDGKIDILDAELAAAYYNESADLTDAQLALADVNGDGTVNILDANLIAAYYTGSIFSFPAA